MSRRRDRLPPLPRSWPTSVKPAVLHVISLAQFGLAYTPSAISATAPENSSKIGLLASLAKRNTLTNEDHFDSVYLLSVVRKGATFAARSTPTYGWSHEQNREEEPVLTSSADDSTSPRNGSPFSPLPTCFSWSQHLQFIVTSNSDPSCDETK